MVVASGLKGRLGDCCHPTTAMANGCPAERPGRRRHHEQQHAEAAKTHGQAFNSANVIDLGKHSPMTVADAPSQHIWWAAPEHLQRYCGEQHRADTRYPSSNSTAPNPGSAANVAVS